MPANRALPLAANQPKPCGERSEADAPATMCDAVVEIVIVAVAPAPVTDTEVGLMEQVICAPAEADWQVRATMPLKPAIDSRTIVEVACWPGAEAVAE